MGVVSIYSRDGYMHTQKLPTLQLYYLPSYLFSFVGPENPPQDFTAIDTTVSVTFSWNPPTIPNGIITEYNLTVMTNGTSIPNVLNADTETFTVLRFVPYQEYSATIAAATVAGYGPIDNITGRTNPDSKYCTL